MLNELTKIDCHNIAAAYCLCYQSQWTFTNTQRHYSQAKPQTVDNHFSAIMINNLRLCERLHWLSLRRLKHDRLSKGSAPPEWLALLAVVHVVACRQALGQHGSLLCCIFGNVHYASNLLLRSLHICPFKDRQKGPICQWWFTDPTMGIAEALDAERIYEADA